MKYSKVIQSPTGFLVEEYTPGFTIDFRSPPESTDLQKVRESFRLNHFADCDSDAHLAEAVGRTLIDLGITDDVADFSMSLRKFTEQDNLNAQLDHCLMRLGVDQIPEEPVAKIGLLLKVTGCLSKYDHYPIRLYCHIPGETTVLEEGCTHFGYVLEGECLSVEPSRNVVIKENMYFCITGPAEIRGDGKCEIVTHFDHLGMTHYGGEVEDWGRLNYIDGCTDTVLIPPSRKGDPCYNALFFPANTEQTQHVHPSLRCGLVISGQGVCKTPKGDFPLTKGHVFFLPPETYHSFHTSENITDGRSALTVLAFHPDSDFGPTDEDHPMVNRTYFRFLHRIVSTMKNPRTEVHREIRETLGIT